MKLNEKILRNPEWWDENVESWAQAIAIETDARGGFVRIKQSLSLNGAMIEDLDSPDNDVTVYERPAKPAASSKIMDDNCLSAKIGEIGNQIHNLGCENQSNEDLSDSLGKLACSLWDLAGHAPKESAPSAPEGATHYDPETSEWYMKESQDFWMIWQRVSYVQHAWLKATTPDEGKLMKIKEEWDGKGLPPVGTICEYHSRVDDVWRGPVTVFHITKRGTCFAEYASGEYEVSADQKRFRPIRTKEQMEWLELESIIRKELSIVGDSVLIDFCVDAILDAGYHK